MDLFSFLSFHFICVTMTVVTGHSVALSRRSYLFSTMSSLHDVLVHDSSFISVFRMFVGCCIWIVFVLENFIRNLLMFSGGMGFSIFGLLLFGVCKCILAMM
jgi:hypothetical protein